MKRYIIYVILLSLIEISAALYITHWRELFWNYVEQRNFHGFCIQIGVFSAIAIGFCIVNAYAGYYMSLCAIKYRELLNSKASDLADEKSLQGSYYKFDCLTGAREPAENLNQRIQEDCKDYPDLLLQLIFGFGKALVYIVLFSVYLVIQCNVYYLIIITLYAVISTLVAKRIATPLIQLNYNHQQVEATYRNGITNINFSNCISVMFQLATSTKRLQYFQTLYAQIAVVLPIIIVAPAYFDGALTLGMLMMATGMMATVKENLSFGITNFATINKFKSCKRRLTEIGVI